MMKISSVYWWFLKVVNWIFFHADYLFFGTRDFLILITKSNNPAITVIPTIPTAVQKRGFGEVGAGLETGRSVFAWLRKLANSDWERVEC